MGFTPAPVPSLSAAARLVRGRLRRWPPPPCVVAACLWGGALRCAPGCRWRRRRSPALLTLRGSSGGDSVAGPWLAAAAARLIGGRLCFWTRLSAAARLFGRRLCHWSLALCCCAVHRGAASLLDPALCCCVPLPEAAPLHDRALCCGAARLGAAPLLIPGSQLRAARREAAPLLDPALLRRGSLGATPLLVPGSQLRSARWELAPLLVLALSFVRLVGRRLRYWTRPSAAARLVGSGSATGPYLSAACGSSGGGSATGPALCCCVRLVGGGFTTGPCSLLLRGSGGGRLRCWTRLSAAAWLVGGGSARCWSPPLCAVAACLRSGALRCVLGGRWRRHRSPALLTLRGSSEGDSAAGPQLSACAAHRGRLRYWTWLSAAARLVGRRPPHSTSAPPVRGAAPRLRFASFAAGGAPAGVGERVVVAPRYFLCHRPGPLGGALLGSLANSHAAPCGAAPVRRRRGMFFLS